jgi:glycosyltransferase involved in cell wall biosynthesis
MRSVTSTTRPRRLAVVVSTFPRPVDAYMLRELLALGERGLDVRIYSLRRPSTTGIPHAAAALAQATVYAPAVLTRATLGAHCRELVAAPLRYTRTFAGLCVRHARSPRLLAKVIATWPQTVYFAERARRDGVDHVHANWATYPAAAASAIAALTGLPWSFAGHASDIHLEPTGLAAKIGTANFVVTCTEESRRYLTGVAPDTDPRRIKTVHHGTDLAAFRRTRVEPPDLHVLAVGTLRRCKGFDTLLRAVAQLRGDGIPTRVTIVGDGEERGGLTTLARELGLVGCATFTGYVPHDELPRLYAAATVLAQPSRAAEHFGIPNVIIEAQAASLPVVTTSLPALDELMTDGVSGIYVAEDDVTALAATLRTLANEPDRRRRLAAAGLERVTALFDIERTADVLAALFGGRPRPAAAIDRRRVAVA